jgi:hypothetical protein
VITVVRCRSRSPRGARRPSDCSTRRASCGRCQAVNSTLAPVEGVRVYRIDARGAGSWPAVNLSFQFGPAGLGQYWDVMETTMPLPPLLAQATDSVTAGGRVYEIVNDGSGARVVAFRRRGTWYWVNNTINDALTPAQMLEIAEHLA